MKNPIIKGWYADPEARIYNGKVYLYVTNSLPFEEQKNLAVVVSEDLERFFVIDDILDMTTFQGAKMAIWAPSVIEKSGKYYIIFSANDIKKDGQIGGLYIGVSDSPDGKFKNIFKNGQPFLNIFINGAQPIDPHFFKDGEDIYLYYGGWGHLNFAKMNDSMDGLELINEAKDKKLFLELTPKDYVEAPCMLKIKNKYCLMYSSGNWTNGTYCVKTSMGESPFGPFIEGETILKESLLADGPGHNGVFEFNGRCYIAYHRRIKGDAVSYHRILCVDELRIEQGKIQPVEMT